MSEPAACAPVVDGPAIDATFARATVASADDFASASSSARSEAGGRSPAFKRLSTALFVVGLLVSLLPWVSAAGALALGLLLGVALDLSGASGEAVPAWQSKLSGLLLRTGVVLLGFRMGFSELLGTGLDGLLVACVTIAGTMGLGYLIGRRLGVASRTSSLISAGTAVCGGSAIAAIAPVVGAAQAEIAIALATVFVLNAVALYLFPVAGHALALTPEQFGLWSGIAIHDLSSVVGAASLYGTEALQIATAVKLSRTLWIAPLALALGFAISRGAEAGSARVRPPYFIGLFLLASASRDFHPLIATVAPALGALAGALLTAALFVIGASLRLGNLRRVGWRPMTQGLVLWVFISLAALVAALFS